MAKKEEVRPKINNMEIYSAAEHMMDGLQRAINALGTADEFKTNENISSYDLIKELEEIIGNPPLVLWWRHNDK